MINRNQASKNSVYNQNDEQRIKNDAISRNTMDDMLKRKVDNIYDTETTNKYGDKNKTININKVHSLFNTTNFNYDQPNINTNNDSNIFNKEDQIIDDIFGEYKKEIDLKQNFEKLYSIDSYQNVGLYSLGQTNKFQQIIDEKDAFTAAEDPFGVKRGCCDLCKLDCKR